MEQLTPLWQGIAWLAISGVVIVCLAAIYAGLNCKIERDRERGRERREKQDTKSTV